MHFSSFVCRFFALCGEKTAYKNGKYQAAVRPEPIEGQAKTASCV